jgi:hypothetical protein
VYGLVNGFDNSVSGEEWRNIIIQKENGGVAFGEIASSQRTFIRHITKGSHDLLRVVKNSSGTFGIETGDYHRIYWLVRVLSKSFLHSGYHAEDLTEDGGNEVFAFSRVQEDVNVTKEGLRHLLRRMKKALIKQYYRATIAPRPNEYVALRYSPKAPIAHALHHVSWFRHRMVCPFVFNYQVGLPNLGNLVDWIARNTDNSAISKREIAQALLRFIYDIDALMRDEWAGFVAYDLTKAKHELGRHVD